MIINPSAHTMIPRRNSYRRRYNSRSRYQVKTLPGGKQLWFAAAKFAVASVMFLFVASFLLNGVSERVTMEIANLELSQTELVEDNILLLAQKAHHFSPEVVASVVGNQLEIHIPAPGQYRKL
ncbi:MAG: hypothetical protein KAR01_08980 [Desulfocapsa sp.]|nr:hypothetical protein [Desulfocapsa sp.]